MARKIRLPLLLGVFSAAQAETVSGNPPQVARLRRIADLQERWNA